MDEKASYVLMNSVRRGLCERAGDWVWATVRIIVRPPELVKRGSIGRARTPVRAVYEPKRRAEDCPPYRSGLHHLRLTKLSQI